MTLTPEQRIEIKANLENRRNELKKQLSEIAIKRDGAYEVKVPEYGSDETENASEVTTIANEIALKEQLEKDLEDVEKSLADLG